MVSARRDGIVDRLHAHQDLGLNLLVELHVHLERRSARSASAPRPRRRPSRRLGDLVDLDEEERVVCRRSGVIARARLPSTSTFTVPSGRRSSCMIAPTVPTAKMSSGVGSLVLALLLRGEEDLLVAAHRLVERGDRSLAADEELRDHVREHDDVAQRQQRERCRARRPLPRARCRS